MNTIYIGKFCYAPIINSKYKFETLVWQLIKGLARNYSVFKSNQKQQNLTEQQSLQKSEAQVPTHNIKINDKPFHPPTGYVFPKSKSGDRLRPYQAHWLKKFPWLHYDEKYFFFSYFFLHNFL